jgi:hypothetical protein
MKAGKSNKNSKTYNDKSNKNIKTKSNANIIASTFDERCITPAYNNKKKTGVGCVICEPAPIYCPYFDAGTECECVDQCDFKYDYEPKKIYKTKAEIIDHLHTHNLTITKELLDFYFK